MSALSFSAVWRRLGFGLSLLLLVMASSSAHAEAKVKTLLWLIKSGNQTGYILGSIHVARADFYPLPAHVERAYQGAGVLAVEVDASSEETVAKIKPMMVYGDADRLENHLKPATLNKLKALIGEPGMAQFQHLKPATAATALSIAALSQLGFSTKDGIDLHFLNRAKKDKKRIQELESAEFQGSLIGGLSDEDGDAMLSQTLDNISNGEAVRLVKDMVSAWQSGNAPGLAKLIEESAEKDQGSKKLMKLLFDERNVGMADNIAKLVKSGKHPFIVIGAGHMTGPNNILTLLEKQGFQVRQKP